ncbi:MAG: ArsR/SmtB family transcription factor [Candidatus Geothermincolia bacterium]
MKFDLDAALKALACERRRRIFEMIRGARDLPERPSHWREDEVCVCRLVAESGLADSTVSHHLTVLRDAGLVSSRRDGRWIHYTVCAEALDRLKAEVASL